MTLTPMKSIRKKCVDCSNGELKEIRNCVIPTCALYPYRMGRRPMATGMTIPRENQLASKGVCECIEEIGENIR